MESLIENVKNQCCCKSRALGRQGNYEFVNLLKKYLTKYKITYTTEEYEYKYFQSLEGSITLDSITYYAKTFAGAPPFFPYEYDDTYMINGDEKFGLSEISEVYIEKLENREGLIERMQSILDRKEIKAMVFVIPRTSDAELIDIVVPISNLKADRIKYFRNIPIIAISDDTWNTIQKIKINKVEIKHKSNIDYAVHENVIVEFGNRERQICLCSHIDSAFERVDIEGAHDNASGVAVMMKLVIEISKIKELNRGIKFIFYNGEEYNMIGCINMVIDEKKYFIQHNYEDLFYMFHSGALKEYVIFKAEEIIEIDVIGEGKVLNIFTNESAQKMMELLPKLKADGIEKVLLHNGGVSVYYILSKLNCNMKFHFSQLSNMLHLVHTTKDNMLNLDENSLNLYYDFIASYVKLKLNTELSS